MRSQLPPVQRIKLLKMIPTAYGKIDILCNNVQSELFQHDPRINRIIRPHPSLLPTIDRKTWMKALFLDARALSLSRFLRDRNYEAVLPGIVAPVFYSQSTCSSHTLRCLQTCSRIPGTSLLTR